MSKYLLEAKKLTIYKKLIRLFGDYSERFPATGVDNYFKVATEKGVKILPGNSRAQDIVYSILDDDTSVPTKVTDLLNKRFSDLDMDIRPMFKNGKRKEVAFWERDGQITDKVIDLIGWEDGKTGRWVNAHGEKVSLIDMEETPEEEKEASQDKGA